MFKATTATFEDTTFLFLSHKSDYCKVTEVLSFAD